MNISEIFKKYYTSKVITPLIAVQHYDGIMETGEMQKGRTEFILSPACFKPGEYKITSILSSDSFNQDNVDLLNKYKVPLIHTKEGSLPDCIIGTRTSELQDRGFTPVSMTEFILLAKLKGCDVENDPTVDLKINPSDVKSYMLGKYSAYFIPALNDLYKDSNATSQHKVINDPVAVLNDHYVSIKTKYNENLDLELSDHDVKTMRQLTHLNDVLITTASFADFNQLDSSETSKMLLDQVRVFSHEVNSSTIGIHENKEINNTLNKIIKNIESKIKQNDPQVDLDSYKSNSL